MRLTGPAKMLSFFAILASLPPALQHEIDCMMTQDVAAAHAAAHETASIKLAKLDSIETYVRHTLSQRGDDPAVQEQCDALLARTMHLRDTLQEELGWARDTPPRGRSYPTITAIPAIPAIPAA